MRTNNLSRTFALVVGVVLVLAGIVGLLTGVGQDETTTVLGLEVNLAHNLVHLLTGALALAVASGRVMSARTFALGFGAIYLILGILGLMNDRPLGDLLGHVNEVDDVIHLGVGVAGLAAGIADGRRGRRDVL